MGTAAGGLTLSMLAGLAKGKAGAKIDVVVDNGGKGEGKGPERE